MIKTPRVFVCGDVHVPYHDAAAVKACVRAAGEFKPDVFVMNGDLLDFEALSRFLSNPRTVSDPQKELDVGAAMLRRFEAAVGSKCRRVFLLGNHEERLEKYLTKNAPQLLSLRSLNLSDLLGLAGWTVVQYPQFHKIGGLIVQHGVSYGSTTIDRNIAKFGGFDCVQGHSHRISQRYVTSLHGTHSSVEGGCLCKLEQPYSKHNNWQQGWVTHDEKGLRTHAYQE